jgi:hypothetical protein
MPQRSTRHSRGAVIAEIEPIHLGRSNASDSAGSVVCCCGMCGGEADRKRHYSAGKLISGRYSTICRSAIDLVRKRLERPEFNLVELRANDLPAARLARQWVLAWRSGPGGQLGTPIQHCLVYDCGHGHRVFTVTTIDESFRSLQLSSTLRSRMLTRLSRQGRCAFCGGSPRNRANFAVGATTVKICDTCAWTVASLDD